MIIQHRRFADHVCSTAIVTSACLVVSVFQAPGHAKADCPVPAQFPHATSVPVGDLRFTVASDRTTYAVGQPIAMYLSVENTGPSPVVIPNPCGCTPLAAFSILPEACQTPLPPACKPPPSWYPDAHFFFGLPITVSPGQCLAYTRTWEGMPDLGGTTTAGAYVVAAGMSATIGTFFLPQTGVRLPIEIGDQSVSTRVPTWGMVKLIYR